MRNLEQNVYRKLKQDFATELTILEESIDILVRCVQVLSQKAPLLDKPNLRINLLNANSQDRCSVTHTLLLYHAVTCLKSARLLLLTGYIVPSLSCLRTAFESFQNAHICLMSDEQAIRLLNGKQLNKKAEIDYPIQLDEKRAKEIKSTLSSYGVHANYQALETQALYEGSVFIRENRTTYEFLFIRNIYSFLSIQLLLLHYLLDTGAFLKKEVPDAENVTREIAAKIIDVVARIEELSLSNSVSK